MIDTVHIIIIPRNDWRVFCMESPSHSPCLMPNYQKYHRFTFDTYTVAMIRATREIINVWNIPEKNKIALTIVSCSLFGERGCLPHPKMLWNEKHTILIMWYLLFLDSGYEMAGHILSACLISDIRQEVLGRGQVAGCAGAGIGRRGGLPSGRGE